MAHITFVHGIGNKPAPDELLRECKIALSDNDGVDLDALGVTTSMVYWADMLHASPAAEQTAQESSPADMEAMVDAQDADLRWLDDVPPDERALVEALARKVGLADVGATTDGAAPDPSAEGSPLEAVPLPSWLERRLMRVLLRDVHHFLYDVDFIPRPGETYKIRAESARECSRRSTTPTAGPDPTSCSGTASAASSPMTRSPRSTTPHRSTRW